MIRKIFITGIVSALVLLTTGCLGAPPRQSGVFTTKDGGVSWRATPDLKDRKTKVPKVYPPLETTAVAVSPQDSQFVVTGTEDNLYRSKDGGATWQLLSERLPAATKSIAVQQIAFSPSLPDTFYVAGVSGGYGKLIRASSDGDNLEEVFTSSRPRQAVTAVAVDVRNPGTVLLGDESGGLFRSTDTGNTWRRVATLDATVTSLAAAGGSWYAGSMGDGIWRSDDGQTFYPVSKQLSSKQKQVWAVATGFGSIFAGTDGGLIRSSNGGQTWQSVDNPIPPQGQRVQALAVAGAYLYVGTNAVVYMLAPEGDRFSAVQLKLAQNVFGLSPAPSELGVLYAAANSTTANMADRYSPSPSRGGALQPVGIPQQQ